MIAVNSTVEYRPWERAGQVLVSSKRGDAGAAEYSGLFIVFRQGTAKNLSVSVAPRRMQR